MAHLKAKARGFVNFQEKFEKNSLYKKLRLERFAVICKLADRGAKIKMFLSLSLSKQQT